MNISKKETLILEQLIKAGSSELYGLEMVRASNGALKMGTIYVTLARLEEKGFVESHRENEPKQTVPRRLYKITGAGRKTYLAVSAAIAAYNSSLNGEFA
ncbi:PadR family transcriptional regulator [Variovorax beijingensis]|nr:helix-turn-helix transcriptional regulator [Variovorax beijingensis]